MTISDICSNENTEKSDEERAKSEVELPRQYVLSKSRRGRSQKKQQEWKDNRRRHAVERLLRLVRKEHDTNEIKQYR